MFNSSMILYFIDKGLYVVSPKRNFPIRRECIVGVHDHLSYCGVVKINAFTL
jgi:hypothetical protein